ncbi:hypothetical protein [Vibrio sp. HN007]|uniref:hypothetical protein n=1 Tax=Vibrio iocasae TaxID=3098914 RepID=UPI0035D43A26
MKKLSLIVVPLLFLLSADPAAARYCTTKNWETSTSYYKKQEKRYNGNVKAANIEIEQYNSYEFLQDSFNSDQLAQIWLGDNDAAKLALNTQKDLFMDEVIKLNKVRSKILATMKKLKTNKELWEKLADYCYDEDNYKDYKAGRDNMRKGINLQKQADELLSKVERIKLRYLKEVGLINSSKDKAREHCESTGATCGDFD